MPLKSQDIVVCLKLAVWPDEGWKFDTLAASLGMSASETHAAVKRLRGSRLLDASGKRPLRRNLTEMLVCGVKYFHAAERKGQTRGLPTAYAAEPLKTLMSDLDTPPPVWPWSEGTIYGFELSPLYRTVPLAALRDASLYELLALVDAIRLHEARVGRLAEEILTDRLKELSLKWHPHLDARLRSSL